jgi:ribosomal protein S12 methylthiotransferase
MEIQMNIMQEQGEAMAGRTLRVLAEGFDRYAECWFGRSYMDSPDVDGKIYFQQKGRRPVPGRFMDVRITDCIDGDLTGETV